MTRKIWISSALALATALLVLAPTTAFAGSPLLSGYGGPGAGEQAILGSTLVGGGAGGSSGSGGSGGANLYGSAGGSTSNVGGTSSTGSGSARGSGVGAANAGSGSRETTSKGGALRGPRGGRSTGVGDGAASAYVYSTSQGSVASASPLTGISSGDVLLLVGILATLGLVAVFTLRLSRLQS
ncbi:MAG TPA: hypothetical protein VK730_12715 [Solirubrobacteraceae bacterium]|jgi:hypothetical protein|nr:hypothetical protein [Solirubrobacteraceae bacterium]